MGKLVRVVNNRDARVVISCETRDAKGVLTIDELVLESGANNVEQSRVEAFCKEGSPSAGLFEHGVLDVQDLPEPVKESLPQAGGDISKLTEAAALKAVAASKNKEQLKNWVRQDGRKKVREALFKRHEELTKAEDSGSSED